MGVDVSWVWLINIGEEMASQVANIIKLTEKTSGRDKLCRIVQYGSKFVYWVLEQGSLSPQLIIKLKALERSISTARKCKALQAVFCTRISRSLVLG